MSEVSKAHEKELANMNAANAVLKAQLQKALTDVKDFWTKLDQNWTELAGMNAANAVLKTQLESALADVKDLKQKTLDRQAEIAVLQKEVEAQRKEVADINKELQEAKQVSKAHERELAEMNAANAVLKAQLVKALAQVSALEKHLKETHEEGKDQVVQLKAQVAVLDRKLEGAALEMKEKLSEVSKAHDKELAEMNAANAVLQAQVEKALADVKNLQSSLGIGTALRSQLEKEVEDKSEKLSGLGKKCQVQVDRIKQLREELASNQKLLADNKKNDDQVIASGKAEIQALKNKVLALEEKLSEGDKAHEKELEDMNSANAVLKAQLCVRQEGIETLKAQVSSLEKQLKRM